MSENPASRDRPGATASPSTSEKILAFIVMAAGLAAMFYLEWSVLRQWPWTKGIWWHWLVGFFEFALLLVGPIFALLGAISLTTNSPRTSRLFRWITSSNLAMITLGSLIYLALIPSEPSWNVWHWLIWGTISVLLSIFATGARMFTTVQMVAAQKKARPSFEHEWRFNGSGKKTPPKVGLAMSGGGIRSAAVNMGVMQGLHEAKLLRSVDVMSAVSGGSYAMSWYFLHPYYAAAGDVNADIEQVIDEMFETNGRFQEHLHGHPTVVTTPEVIFGAIFSATIEQPFRAFFSMDDDVELANTGGPPRRTYREGIQKLFHGHPDKKEPKKLSNEIGFSLTSSTSVTNFASVEPVTYRKLAHFACGHGLPFFIFNGATLVDRAHRHMIWPINFEITADDIGSDLIGYRNWEEVEAMQDSERKKALNSGPPHLNRWSSQVDRDRGLWLRMVNIAPAISGAAVGLARFDPDKEEGAMKLATWLPFIANVDLGYLYPRKLFDLETNLYVSDGGHVDNLGLYALIKRHCQNIIVVDAEQEARFIYKFDAYVKLRDQLKDVDEGAIEVNIPEIDAYLSNVKRAENEGLNIPAAPVVTTGTVTIPPDSDSEGQVLSVVYLKLGVGSDRGEYPQLVLDMADDKSDRFPQDSTINQSYKPRRFRAYRELGRSLARIAVKKHRATIEV